MVWPGAVVLEGKVDGASDARTGHGWDYDLGCLVGVAVDALTYEDDFNAYNFLVGVVLGHTSFDGGILYRLIRAAVNIDLEDEDLVEATAFLRKRIDERKADAENDQ